MHIIFNLLFQLFLGIPLEMVHKWWRMGIVYSAGVIAGNIIFKKIDESYLLTRSKIALDAPLPSYIFSRFLQA